jgi:UDP-2-acetamido-3-amino-2,3-dideoxy-glucuronate N-acetyltransferase
MIATMIPVDSFTDERGNLVVGEFPKNLPFAPVRFFLVGEVPPSEIRGNHAHKTNQQFLLCISGSIKVRVYNGVEWQEFNLHSKTAGLFIPALHWAEQEYVTSGSQLLVLASEKYSASGYINSLAEFDTHLARVQNNS